MAGINTQIVLQNCDSHMDELVCIHAQDFPTMQIGDIIEIQPKYPDPSVTMASPKIGFFERVFGNPGTSGCTPESFAFRPNYFCRNCCGGTNQFGIPYWGNIQPQGVCHKNCTSWKFDPPTVPKGNETKGTIKAAPHGYHYMPDGALMSDAEPMTNSGGDYNLTQDPINLKDFVHPTQGPTDPGTPYIGKCYDIFSYIKCAMSISNDTVFRTMTDQMQDHIQMIYGVNGATTWLPILNSSPTGYTQVGFTPAATAVLDLERDDFILTQMGNYFGAANNPLTPGGYDPSGLPYNNGCPAFDGVMNGWAWSNDNWILERAQTPGHIPINTGTMGNTQVFSSANGGSNLHYQWWLLDAKINWAIAMKECCDCNERGTTGGMPDTQPRLGAPTGYHYMPNGVLMSDDEHDRISNEYIIKGFDLDLYNISASGENREFTITGDPGAVFSLEVKRGDGYYYNFQTQSFQVTKTGLNNEIINSGGNDFIESSNVLVTVQDCVTQASYTGVCMTSQDQSLLQIGDIIQSPPVSNYSGKGFYKGYSTPSSSCTLVNYSVIDEFCENCCEQGPPPFSIWTWWQGGQTPEGTCYNNCFTSDHKFDPPTVPKGKIRSGVYKSKTYGSGTYKGKIVFPVVAAADQYDIYLTAEKNTKHNIYDEVRFSDDTVDINSSTGSKSFLLQKVIYQTLNNTITLSSYSPGSVISSIVDTSDTITTVREQGIIIPIPFEIKATFNSGAITIDRQPISSDIMTFVTRTIGAAPVDIPGENIYPTITSNDNTNAVMSSTTTVTMTNSIADLEIKVGDKVIQAAGPYFANVVTVVATSGGGLNAYQFTASEAVSVGSGVRLDFYNRRNYRWPLNNIDLLKDGMSILGNTVNGFTNSARIKEYLDEITVFEGEKEEYKLEIEKVKSLDTLSVKPTLTRDAVTKVLSTVQTGNITFNQQALLAMSSTTAKIFAYGTDAIKRLNDYDIEFSDLKAELNTITTTTTADTTGSASTTMAVASVVGIADETTQTVDGAIVDSQVVVLDSIDGLFVGQTIYAVSSGTLTGNPTIISMKEDGKIINISSEQTFADGITLSFANSIVSGIGIDNSVINPYVDSISSLNLTLSTAQALESGQTFTFSGAGNIVTITGNIKINYAGNEDITLRFDVNKFLTQHL